MRSTRSRKSQPPSFKALGGLTFASPGHPGAYDTRSSIFSPRAGFAWVPKKLGARTVIRGGFGVFVTPIGISNALALNQQGFSGTTQFVATNNNYLSILAHVMAHEIGHLLLNWKTHSKERIMRAEWTVVEFAAMRERKLFFTSSEARTMRHAVQKRIKLRPSGSFANRVAI